MATNRPAAMLDSWGAGVRNRDAFLLNNRMSIIRFGELHQIFEQVWRILGVARDSRGRSHAGLLTLIPIFERQLIVGINNLAMHQVPMTWLSFRPGLEALLFVGVWAEDPANAAVWGNWESDRKAFMKAFDGRSIRKTRLPAALELSSVLTEINDRYAHPNPLFQGHGEAIRGGKDFIEVSQSFYDDAATVEAHFLAYLSLLEMCVISSATFIRDIIEISGAPAAPDRKIPSLYSKQSDALREAGFSNVLEDLGLWSWSAPTAT